MTPDQKSRMEEEAKKHGKAASESGASAYTAAKEAYLFGFAAGQRNPTPPTQPDAEKLAEEYRIHSFHGGDEIADAFLAGYRAALAQVADKQLSRQSAPETAEKLPLGDSQAEKEGKDEA